MPHSVHPLRRRMRRSGKAHAERGVVMVIALVALLIMLIGGITLIRSFDTSLLLAGNLAFKRDLVNQGERGIVKVIGLMTSGALSSETTREANQLGNNYSASVLASDIHGIPNVLVNTSTFSSAGMTAADLTDATSGVTIRYVIDRQCTAAGAFDVSSCMTTSTASDKSGTSWIKRAGGENRPIYRISIKVTGPRKTEAYLQSTVVL